MASIASQLAVRQFANGVIEGIRDNIRSKSVTRYGAVNVTGNAASSIQHKWDSGKLIIFSSWDFIMVLETGRRPGKQPPSNVILEWINNRGITPEGITKNSLAFLIARKIGREGTEIWKQYGSSGRGSGIISDFISEEYISKNLTPDIARQVNVIIDNELKEINFT